MVHTLGQGVFFNQISVEVNSLLGALVVNRDNLKLSLVGSHKMQVTYLDLSYCFNFTLELLKILFSVYMYWCM